MKAQSAMQAQSARLALLFSCLGHAYMHVFTAFYFVIALSLVIDWGIPNHDLVKLWALGSLLAGPAVIGLFGAIYPPLTPLPRDSGARGSRQPASCRTVAG